MPISVAEALASLDRAVDDDRIESLARAFGVDLLTLFGSANDDRPGGAPAGDPKDINIAIGFSPGAERDLLGAVDALSALVPGDHLDVMDLDRAGPVARVEALVGARVLYEGGPEIFTRRELNALGEYLDTAYLREALLRDLAR